ncbi:sulfatase-like hydrolase/transferase [bacterium]|nr:sulfatase-like hydrolase/transferase [bacterium]
MTDNDGLTSIYQTSNSADRQLGTILDHLDDPNNDGNTSDSITNDALVIFTSDTGADSKNFNENYTRGYNINHTLRGQKSDIHEGEHRVPFIAKLPSQITAGTTTDETA